MLKKVHIAVQEIKKRDKTPKYSLAQNVNFMLIKMIVDIFSLVNQQRKKDRNQFLEITRYT